MIKINTTILPKKKSKLTMELRSMKKNKKNNKKVNKEEIISSKKSF